MTMVVGTAISLGALGAESCVSVTSPDGHIKLAFVLLAVLGVPQDEIDRDWATTSFLPESAFLPLGATLKFFQTSRYEKISLNLARYPGGSLRERVEAFLIDCGVTADEIERFRTIMLEPSYHR